MGSYVDLVDPSAQKVRPHRLWQVGQEQTEVIRATFKRAVYI